MGTGLSWKNMPQPFVVTSVNVLMMSQSPGGSPSTPIRNPGSM